MATISDGNVTITPTLVSGYEAGRVSGSIAHELLAGELAVSLAPAKLRAGRLEVLFTSEADAAQCEDMHALPARFTLTIPERPTLNMQYVLAPDGEVTRELTGNTWVVTVQFQEVA